LASHVSREYLILYLWLYQSDAVSDDDDKEKSSDEADTGSNDIRTSPSDNICTLPVAIGDCKSYQVRFTYRTVLFDVVN